MITKYERFVRGSEVWARKNSFVTRYFEFDKKTIRVDIADDNCIDYYDDTDNFLCWGVDMNYAVEHSSLKHIEVLIKIKIAIALRRELECD